MTPTPPRNEKDAALPRARSNEQCIELLQAALTKALNGDIIAAVLVTENVDGTVQSGFTECSNVFSLGGAAIAVAIRRMGFSSQ